MNFTVTKIKSTKQSFRSTSFLWVSLPSDCPQPLSIGLSIGLHVISYSHWSFYRFISHMVKQSSEKFYHLFPHRCYPYFLPNINVLEKHS